MTQILVTLNEGAPTQSVRRAIGLLKGVSATTVVKTSADNDRKTLAQQKYVRESLTRALNEVKEAKRTGRQLQSADDFIKELEMEEAL